MTDPTWQEIEEKAVRMLDLVKKAVHGPEYKTWSSEFKGALAEIESNLMSVVEECRNIQGKPRT